MEGSNLLLAGVLFLFAAVVAVPLASRIGIGAVLGYLLAGIAIGPWGLGFISDVDEILHFSELGVVFLMFIIGLELNPSKLWQLRRSIFGVGAAQVLLSAALLVWGRPVLLACGASENTIGYATDYLSIYALGTLFVQLTLGMNAFITAQGFTKISMVSVVIGAVCNIVLDPIFIYAFGMGVRGAALATILSQAVSCCWVLVFLTGKKTLLRLQRRNLRLSPRILLPCLALGLAPFIMGASESVIAVCYNSSLLAAGGDIAVGAMTILTSVMQFALLPLQGLGQGAQPIASYNYGAKNPQRVRATFWLLLKVSLLYSAVFWALLMLAPQVFVGMFTADAALAAFTINAMRVYFAVLLVFGLQVACQMTFIAIGSAKASITVAVMRKFVLLIPLIYLLPRLFSAAPTTAIYAAEPVADLLAVTFTAVLFGIQFKKSMKKLESERQAPAAQ